MEKAEKQRIVFTFDKKNLERMERIKERTHLATYAEVVRDALAIDNSLLEQREYGFTEVVVRNPNTREEKVMVMPNA
ncbi:MAG: hypothetical protein OEW12_02055 [Deltaproteobacteria bacterium]|nr:hypothetical protein [Deltaproteobacteria bacterium]